MAASELIRPGNKKTFANEVEPNLLTPMKEMINSLTKRIKMTEEGGKFLSKLAKGADAQEEHIVWSFCGFALLLIIFFYGFSLITTLVAWVYPLYRSCQSVREHEEQEKWLTYWIVYGLVSFLFYFLDWTIYFIPCYDVGKLALYLYLWHPTTNGAVFAYNRYIKPILEANSTSTKERKVIRRT